MAVRAVTPSKEVYCSSCSARASLADDSCPICGADFTGTADGRLCASCQAVVSISSDKCEKCGQKIQPTEHIPGLNEEELLRRMLQWRGMVDLVAKPPADGKGPVAPGTAQTNQDGSPQKPQAPDTSTILWQLFEPLEKVLRYRKNRLEQVDLLITEARKRIGTLENSKDPDLQRERWRLKAWVDEILAERNDLTTIEESMMDMERTYRNIISMQQAELHTKEESIRARLNSFRSEIERIEKEKVSITEKEGEIKRKEDELRKILGKISEKEEELAQLEDRLKDRATEAANQAAELAEMQKQIDKEKWMAEQRRLQTDILTMRKKELASEVEPQELAAVKSRVNELEEHLRELNAERERMAREGEEAKTFLADVSKLLKTLDDLLGQLPPEVIKKFAKGREFQVYERVLEKCGV